MRLVSAQFWLLSASTIHLCVFWFFSIPALSPLPPLLLFLLHRFSLCTHFSCLFAGCQQHTKWSMRKCESRPRHRLKYYCPWAREELRIVFHRFIHLDSFVWADRIGVVRPHAAWPVSFSGAHRRRRIVLSASTIGLALKMQRCTSPPTHIQTNHLKWKGKDESGQVNERKWTFERERERGEGKVRSAFYLS